MMRPILGVTARWREDQPDGFAVSVSFDTPALGDHFARQLRVALEGLDRDARWSPQVALGHLRDVGRIPEASRDETIRRRAVGIVAWLQERGHLVADAHNGVAWQEVQAQAAAETGPPTEPSLRVSKKPARPRAASRERARPAAAKKKTSKKPRKKA